jgi:dTDP-L-rhamnose 4-epimerase
MKNVLITGGAGFIGSNLSIRLLEKGYRVRVLDNLSEQIHGNNSEDSFLYQSIKDKVEFIRGDVRNAADWKKALQDQHIVVHLAAETGTGQSMYEVEKYVDVNIKGTAILLDLLANESHQVEKVVVASSRAIYGEGKYHCSDHQAVYPLERLDEHMSKGDFDPKCPQCHRSVELLATDESSAIHPTSIYGITKQNQEQMVLVACQGLGISAVAFRYQNVYGPGQSLSNPYTGILSIFSTRILNGNPINIFEDGQESRDFVYIDDVVSATILGIEKKEANGGSYNVGSGVCTSVEEVARTLIAKYGKDVELTISGNYRLGDIRHNYADLTNVRKLGFRAEVLFEEGISRFAKWVSSQNIAVDAYETSVQELKDKGLYK